MKNQPLYLSRIIFLLFMLCTAASISSQNNNYYVVQYIKVPPTIENEYLELETQVWKKMHQARITSGRLDGWHLYRVISPSGSNTEYNFVTVQIYNSVEKLSGHFEEYGVDYTKVLSSEEIAYALKTPELRNLVYEEVWQDEDSAINPSSKIFRFQRFNAMKTVDDSADAAYVYIEQNYWKPIHQRRMELGSMNSWGLYHMIIPGGTQRDYTWATVDYYDRFIDIMQDDLNNKLFDEIHGADKTDQYLRETTESRDLLRTEIRELIDYIRPSDNQ